jgi:hypothetical protein
MIHKSYKAPCFHIAQAKNFKVPNDKGFSIKELRGGLIKGIENP